MKNVKYNIISIIILKKIIDFLFIRVDRTYKMYYGGAQKRPDAQYSRAILGSEGQLIGHVGDGNRKDIRNAVEAAHAAAPGLVSV